MICDHSIFDNNLNNLHFLGFLRQNQEVDSFDIKIISFVNSYRNGKKFIDKILLKFNVMSLKT